MDDLFRLNGAVPRDPRVQDWFDHDNPFRILARPWFDLLRGCGEDTLELLHDGRPTVCVGSAAFAYVDAFSAHAAVGFFTGAFLPDPSGLLQGSGRRMRHTKLHARRPVDPAALEALVREAYQDVRRRSAAS